MKKLRKFVVLRSPSVGNYSTAVPALSQAAKKKCATDESPMELDSLWQEFSEQWQTYESSVTPTEPARVDFIPLKL
jgi:hypothetical protein